MQLSVEYQFARSFIASKMSQSSVKGKYRSMMTNDWVEELAKDSQFINMSRSYNGSDNLQDIQHIFFEH